MSVLDNPKWELAAQEVAKGRTQLKAIEAAGYAPHDSNAARLIGNDRVKLRIRELQEQAAMSVKITLEGQLAKLQEVLEQSTTLKQCSAAIAAIREQNELAGLRVQKIEHKAVDQFDSMTDDELRQYVYGDKDLESDQ
jgi:nitroreductase